MEHLHLKSRWPREKRPLAVVVMILLLLSVNAVACGPKPQPALGAEAVSEASEPTAVPQKTAAAETSAPEATVGPSAPAEPGPAETASQPIIEEKKEKMLQLRIDDTAVAVAWEQNESVEALKALCENEPLVIQLSMYGGFEQVGPIGQSLPRNDSQTTTQAGDIVLYSGNQIVVFYGSNSWAYTRLGHITDPDAEGMAALLAHGDVTITISLADAA